MPTVTAICYLSSLLFYGIGSSKMSVLNAGHLSIYDSLTYVLTATVCFVSAIFLIVLGSFAFYVKHHKVRKISRTANVEYRLRAARRSNHRRRALRPEARVRLAQFEYDMILDKRMSS